MGQANKRCPLCLRPPGGKHRNHCPRSKRSHERRASAAEKAGRPKLRWMKGLQTVTNTETGETKEVENPGIPFVNEDKPWYAGGIPRTAREDKKK